ncbi:hypothetical protein M885DRAFT_609737 [Pelagophyceae sp. CCMP2097]|nr:hypothetical protein M885DRAFT_609737 [Pelagophyceae sp. CCMP2097]
MTFASRGRAGGRGPLKSWNAAGSSLGGASVAWNAAGPSRRASGPSRPRVVPPETQPDNFVANAVLESRCAQMLWAFHQRLEIANHRPQPLYDDEARRRIDCSDFSRSPFDDGGAAAAAGDDDNLMFRLEATDAPRSVFVDETEDADADLFGDPDADLEVDDDEDDEPAEPEAMDDDENDADDA